MEIIIEKGHDLFNFFPRIAMHKGIMKQVENTNGHYYEPLTAQDIADYILEIIERRHANI